MANADRARARAVRRVRERDTARRVSETESSTPALDFTAHLTARVQAAQRGRRRDGSALIEAVREGEPLIPLAKNLDDPPEGARVELDGELKITPHFLLDPESRRYAALFTSGELLMTMEQHLGWKTDGESLKFCTLPARFALDMA